MDKTMRMYEAVDNMLTDAWDRARINYDCY